LLAWLQMVTGWTCPAGRQFDHAAVMYEKPQRKDNFALMHIFFSVQVVTNTYVKYFLYLNSHVSQLYCTSHTYVMYCSASV
jgi:hypothetical protein